MERELERRAELELTMKAIIIKGTFSSMENALRDHTQDVVLLSAYPDSMYTVAQRILEAHPNIVGGGIGFVPNFYPHEGRLFEPWAGCSGEDIVVKNLAGPTHDYTLMPFYNKAMERKDFYWSNPYLDTEGGLGLITTLSLPVMDAEDEAIGVMGADISLSWLGDTLNARHMYPSSFNILLTEDGDLIASPASESVDTTTVGLVRALINDSSIVRHKSRSGHSTIIQFRDEHHGKGEIIYANMRGRPHWQIVVTCYDDEVFGPLRIMGLNILALTLLALILLAYIVYRTIKSIRNLDRAELKQERLNVELMTAKRIQDNMLPVQDDEAVGRSDIAVCGRLEAAKEVGGDLFDYFIRDEKLFFCIGDVTGKGVPAAMVMAVTHALLRSAAAHDANPTRIMRTINEAACRRNDSNMFVTLFMGVLDLPTGRLRFCNAGHDHPVLINKRAVELEAKANMPIGLFDDFEYEGEETTLEPGTTLFLYTDGLTEARNPAGDFYGEKNMMAAINDCITDNLTPKQLLDSIKRRLSSFTDSAEQSDDLTMLALLYTPQGKRQLMHETLVMDNDVRQVAQLSTFIKALATRIGLDKSVTSNLRLAIEEAVVNVMQYAYPKETKGQVTLQADVIEPENNDVDYDKNLLQICIIDEGVPFDPTEMPEADTTLNAEERPIGGLGIFLMRELMDSINYERSDGRNILTLKKYIIKQQIKTNDNENDNQ